MRPYGGPGVLLRRLRREGFDRSRTAPALLLFAKMALSWPGATLEGLLRGRRIRATPVPWGPVFIVGHYRSGTTRVHKLLAADERFTSIDTFDLLLPFCPGPLKAALRPALQRAVSLLGLRQGFFHDYRLRLDDPNEMEPWMLGTGSPWSSYWGYLFPRRAAEHLERFVRFRSAAEREGWKRAYDYFVRRSALKGGGRIPVVKDPTNTGRVGALLELYPEARFVHVVRDPRSVFLSMRGLWRETIEPRFALQAVTAEERDALVLRHYGALMSGWISEREAIAEGRMVEVRYEALDPSPLESMRRIYADLRLPPFAAAETAIVRRLDEDRGYRAASYDGVVLEEEVERELSAWRRRLGYGGGA